MDSKKKSKNPLPPSPGAYMPYNEPPPPYTPDQQAPPAAAQYYPSHYHQQQMPQGYYPAQNQMPYYPVQTSGSHGAPVQYGPSTTVVVKNLFDCGARFDRSVQPTIPPPPPGCTPNAAQMASMSGARVMGTQRKQDFWFGDDGAGYTW